jgi:hypothetical protein
MQTKTSALALDRDHAARRFGDVRALADWTGIAVSTLNKWRLTGEGPPFLRVNGRVIYDLQAVERWMLDRTVRSTSEAGATPSRRGRPRKGA